MSTPRHCLATRSCCEMARSLMLPVRDSRCTADVETAAADRPRVRKAVKWLGNGLGRAGKGIWRAMRRSNRHKRQQGLRLTAFQESMSYPPAIRPMWFSDGASPQLASWLVLPALQLPGWLLAPMQQLFQQQQQQQCAPAVSPALQPRVDFTATVVQSEGLARGPRSSRREERQIAKKHRRERKRQQQQECKARRGCHHGSTEAVGSTCLQIAGPHSVGQAFGTGVLVHMINPVNTFPMLLHSAEHLMQQHAQNPLSLNAGSQQQGQHAGTPHQPQPTAGNNSTGLQPPQQLLTVGCRHWGNGWWDGRGLLRVKIYDFAIYVNDRQAQAQLPAEPLQLLGPDGKQDQHNTACRSNLPSLLKSSDSRVDMSLVIKAARDVPLHLLSAEYEKVLRRRLDRVGGSSNDVAALQELLASFRDADRLPAAVTYSTSSSALCTQPKSTADPAADTLSQGSTAGAGAGGNVRKGAMIVFERKDGTDVSARVGPVVLATVRSPKVAEALFDLYLGDSPVSKPAKESAAHTLQRMAARSPPASHPITPDVDNPQAPPCPEVAGPAFYVPSSRGHKILCEGGAVMGRKNKRQGVPAPDGWTVEDLAACVLHMG